MATDEQLDRLRYTIGTENFKWLQNREDNPDLDDFQTTSIAATQPKFSKKFRCPPITHLFLSIYLVKHISLKLLLLLRLLPSFQL